jgi:RNA polymerase sigma factor (sigma-70 family)
MALLNFRSEQLLSNPRQQTDRIREKQFLEHYHWLLNCALQFTRGQRERAEDLVHDVFVQFQIKQVEVAAIEDIRSYLYGILRNLFLLQVRRTARHPMQQFSLLDHDSAEMGLRAEGSFDQLQSADLLIRGCTFACHRKETSLPASILILRFFHGYYTDEICRITGAQRRQVNKWLARGRDEAKQYLDAPYPLPEQEASFKEAPPRNPGDLLLRTPSDF